jgi:bacterioferritin-associated ferredoxin
MIVCHCKVVSDRRIRHAVQSGACDTEQVGDHCGAGTRCGSCRPTIGVLLATLLAPEHAEPAA